MTPLCSSQERWAWSLCQSSKVAEQHGTSSRSCQSRNRASQCLLRRNCDVLQFCCQTCGCYSCDAWGVLKCSKDVPSCLHCTQSGCSSMTTLHGRLATSFWQRQHLHGQDYSNSICAILRLFLSMLKLDSTSVELWTLSRSQSLSPVAEVINGCGKSGEWKLSHQTLVP